MFGNHINLISGLFVGTLIQAEFNGSVTNKARQIGDQYGTLNFEQKNTVPNKFNSVLDLVFSNSKSIKVEKSKLFSV